MEKKKKRGRPKLGEKRVNRGYAFSEEAMEALGTLVERYRTEAPLYLSISRRMVIEALIDYAMRNELEFSALFGAPLELTEDDPSSTLQGP